MSSKMKPGDRLNPGESLVSPNELFRLIMQHDGNLVLYKYVMYRDAIALWASDTMNSANFCELDDDGYLKLYHHEGGKVLESFPPPRITIKGHGTHTYPVVTQIAVPRSEIRVVDVGQMRFVAPNSDTVWHSNESQKNQKKLVIAGSLAVEINGAVDTGPGDKTLINDYKRTIRILAQNDSASIKPGEKLAVESQYGTLTVRSFRLSWDTFKNGYGEVEPLPDSDGNASASTKMKAIKFYKPGEDIVRIDESASGKLTLR